jgi:hypothetical protein
MICKDKTTRTRNSPIYRTIRRLTESTFYMNTLYLESAFYNECYRSIAMPISKQLRERICEQLNDEHIRGQLNDTQK